MNNQTDHTQRDNRFELEKRISQLEEEIKTLHATYQTRDRERLQLLEGIVNGTTNTVTVAEAVRDVQGKIIDFRYILFNNTVKRYMGASIEDTYMIGKTMLELFPGTFANGNFKRYVDVVENNQRYAGIEYHYVYDGVNNWFRESCYAYSECVVVITEDITDQKKKEADLAATSGLLRELQEVFSIGTYDMDTKTSTVRASANMRKICNIDSSQDVLPLQVFTDAIHPEDRAWVAQKVQDGAARDIPFNMEHRINLPNDEIRWILSVGKLALDSEGNKTRLVGFIMDITERKINEQQNQTLFAEVNKITTMGIWHWKEDFSEVICSPELYKLYGLESETIIDAEVNLSVFHPEDVDRISATFKNAVQARRGFIDEQYRIVRANDKQIRHIWAKGAFVNGRLIGVAQDITERVEQEEKLKQSEALLLQSQEIAGLGGWQWNEDFSEVFYTPQLMKMFGFREDTKISLQEGLKLVYPDDIPNLSNILQNVIETKGNYDAQYRIIRANDKAIRTIWAKGKFIKGKLTGVAMDITERKELELKNRQLAIRNDELDNFVYTASHDLRSPLNNMEMLVALLAKQLGSIQENAKVGIHINMLDKSITDLKSMLEDLTTVTEIHPGEKKELVNLADIIEEVQVSLFKQIEEAEARVNVELAVPFLTIPKKHVRSLVFNMLSNALKFRSQERKPIVTVSSQLKNDKLHLIFSDNGIGIKEADQPKVFMIFKRFNPEIAGRGVGMYLVKRVIDFNDGEIYLESEENVGTTFHIQFPTEG
jgi:PAS domain S-box-containing protein